MVLSSATAWIDEVSDGEHAEGNRRARRGGRCGVTLPAQWGIIGGM